MIVVARDGGFFLHFVVVVVAVCRCKLDSRKKINSGDNDRCVRKVVVRLKGEKKVRGGKRCREGKENEKAKVWLEEG